MCQFNCTFIIFRTNTMGRQRFELEYPLLNLGYKFPPAKVQRHMSALEYLASAFSTSGSLQECVRESQSDLPKMMICCADHIFPFSLHRWRTRLDNGQVQLQNGKHVDYHTLMQ